MNEKWQERTRLLAGEKTIERYANAHVLVVGLGGVGAYAAEQLCRAGIGEMTIVDADSVDITNINRQLLATTESIGSSKVSVMAQRLRSINPNIRLHEVQEFLRDEGTIRLLESTKFDYVVDAIDTLSPKVFLIYFTMKMNIPLVSAMGAGGKWDPTMVSVCDIKKTYQCRLAHAIRKRLHKLGIKSGFKAVFSPEIVSESAVIIDSDPEINKLSVTGTISYMPAVFGCHLAATVLQDLRLSTD
jgi:tRNA A37 threonylcarbamoyladenosine dehydratase